MLFRKLDKYRDVGLLILRIGIGIAFIVHGYPKLMGGPEAWTNLGKATSSLGITFAPTFFGLMAALAEVLGGALLVLGLFTRPACFFLLCTMIVATALHIDKGDGFKGYSHALESSIVFLSLILIGPGKISLDKFLSSKQLKG